MVEKQGVEKRLAIGRGRCVKWRVERSEAGAERLDVVVREVVVRPARADERRRWDALMAEHHYPGFKQFAGRGLRHVAEWRGHWVALVVAAERAGPERLPTWNRGHWMIENGNHHPRDASLGEDACRVRVRHAPANNAIMNNIALAIVRHRGFRFVPEALDHFAMRREDAFDAVLSPGQPPQVHRRHPRSVPRFPAAAMRWHRLSQHFGRGRARPFAHQRKSVQWRRTFAKRLNRAKKPATWSTIGPSSPLGLHEMRCVRRVAMLWNRSCAACRSSAISPASTSGGGRALASVRLSSLIQKMSKLSLSRSSRRL